MRLFLLTLLLLLGACGQKEHIEVLRPSIPADLLRPVPGYTGPLPKGERAFALAAHAEQSGRLTCNLRLETIAEIQSPPPK